MTITNEDNMELMSRYKDNHFDLAIVDPPYGIGADYQKESYSQGKTEKVKDTVNNGIKKGGMITYQVQNILLN